MHLVKMQFQAARRSVIEIASSLDDTFDAKTGVHSEVGALTFAQVLKKIADHNGHHLEQAKAAIEEDSGRSRRQVGRTSKSVE